MEFQIEQILSIKDKTYLLAKSLVPNVNFKLSNTCYLGDFPIENWFDIPKASDEKGNQRNDLFSFVLKSNTDKEKIQVSEILELSDKFVTVIDPFYSVSGIVFSVLQCGTGKLDINTSLVSNEENKKWKVIDNTVLIGGKQNMALLKQAEQKLWFLHKLEPINHSTIPEKGAKLQVVTDGS